MTEAELLRYVVEAFEALEIDYMISGSQASIYYGEPRFTQDIDIVADLDVAHVPGLLARFPLPEFYVADDAAREAVTIRGQFNIIHPESGLKIDVIVRRDTPYDRVEFERRQRLPAFEGRDAYFARPEDVILYKMIYYREGGSERHLRDIAGIVRVSGSDVDREYIDEWARRLDVGDIWDAICRRLGER
ncbi:MAG: hypothetical protein ACREM3_15005 [Candidatus Rokuibacteriota bacterium]